ncbi:isocitrate/isopropylmalate dehydrogenase family protein [Puniceicoccaceae bacterium K14]|nr:isocitrate/isopropylmalate dehydrogenase family protein [Puniceicoccaceae bacterium K14]
MSLLYNIALLPGDGIGPDVIAEAVKVLHTVERKLKGVAFELSEYPVGAGEYLRSGTPLPDASIEACRKADAILLGAMGIPTVRWPDGKEMTPQIDLREIFQLYSGVRPIYLYNSIDSPLKDFDMGEIDFVIVRESTEGLFSARLSQSDPSKGEVCDTLRITRKGTERVCRAAFEIARKRRKKCTLIDKANVLPSMVFMRKIFNEIAKDFPDVEADYVYVDAASLFLVQRPNDFDVMVTENMFGDILSDLAAGLVGGMGMAPSADIGDKQAIFQPSHGSAPDIAGKGIANPIATILSTALMLDWLGCEQCKRGANAIRDAVSRVFSNPLNRTSDLGGSVSTEQMGNLISEAIQLNP